MSNEATLDDKAWQKVFEKANILEEIRRSGVCFLKSSILKELGEREPRLMAKIDHARVRPKVFKKHNLNILPTGRGIYAIFKDLNNKCFFNLPSLKKNRHSTIYTSKLNANVFDTLKQGVCTSETDAIEVAYLSSLLNTFCNTQDLILTRRGRFGSDTFNIKLPNKNKLIEVRKAQIEVDSIYETAEVIVLIEAKIGFGKDFNVRQLFYPYKWIQARTNKPIIPILLCHSNGEFRLSKFNLGNQFGELSLIKQEYFFIDEQPVAFLNLDLLLRNLPSATDIDTIPFPQADDMDKVVDVVHAIDQGLTSKEDIGKYFGFNLRQSDYYKNAARYLGLLDGDDLTNRGVRLLKENRRMNRTELIIKCMLARPVFREAIKLLKLKNYDLSLLPTDAFVPIVSKKRIDLSGTTVHRRATTVRQWLKWLIANSNSSDVKNQ